MQSRFDTTYSIKKLNNRKVWRIQKFFYVLAPYSVECCAIGILIGGHEKSKTHP